MQRVARHWRSMILLVLVLRAYITVHAWYDPAHNNTASRLVGPCPWVPKKKTHTHKANSYTVGFRQSALFNWIIFGWILLGLLFIANRVDVKVFYFMLFLEAF